MGDRQLQTVLGLFLGTILYVLVVLRSLDGTLGTEGVPHLAVTVGGALTIVCLLALLFYVHKVARSIMVDNIVTEVARDLHHNIRDLLPEDDDLTERSLPPPAWPWAGTVSLDRSGYIQVVDYDALVTLASREQALLQVTVRAGHFVLRNGEHVIVHAERPLDAEAIKAIRSAFVVGEERTPAQDLEYSLRQLVEIALRALSPAINDPFTAIAVVDRLAAALEEIFGRSLQPAVWRDKAGGARVIAQRSDAQGLTDAAFDTIRQAASGIPAVLIRMADVLGQLAPVLGSVAMREAVEGQLDKLAETAGEARLAPSDRQAILDRVEQARDAISAHRKEGTIHVLWLVAGLGRILVILVVLGSAHFTSGETFDNSGQDVQARARQAFHIVHAETMQRVMYSVWSTGPRFGTAGNGKAVLVPHPRSVTRSWQWHRQDGGWPVRHREDSACDIQPWDRHCEPGR